MTTERRDTPRFAFSHDAELSVSGQKKTCACRIRDLSHGGAFLVTPEALNLSSQPADLILHIRRAGRTQRVRYQTLVARQAADGVGVFFCGIGVPGFVPLVNIVTGRFQRAE